VSSGRVKGWQRVEVFDDSGCEGDESDRVGYNRLLDTLG
jgi:hypothetical protein